MTASVDLDGDQLIATRHLDAEPALVWEAFTMPENLAVMPKDVGRVDATIRSEGQQGRVSTDLAGHPEGWRPSGCPVTGPRGGEVVGLVRRTLPALGVAR